MFESGQQRGQAHAVLAVDIAPLIDVVFILLIFFLLTTTFVQETGIELERPQAVYREALEPRSLRVSITASGAVYVEGGRVELEALRGRIGQFLGREPAGSVVLIPDERVTAGRLVQVMDAARLAGATGIAVATEERRGP